MARRAQTRWEGDGSGELDETRKKQVAREVLGRLNAPASFGQRKARVLACMQQSVREVARYVRGEVETPGLYRWDVRGPKEPAQASQGVDALEKLFCRTRSQRSLR